MVHTLLGTSQISRSIWYTLEYAAHIHIMYFKTEITYISQRALIRDKSKKNIATYLIHNLEPILFHFVFVREQTKSLNFWSLCLCLDKKIMLPIFEPIFFITLAFFTLPLFGPIFDHLSKSLIMLPFLGQFFYHFVLLLEPVTLPCTIREIYIRQSLKASLKLCMYCHIQLHTADHSLTTQQ